jgi:glycosyltransferase involved in cell wall biosynthesis
MTLRSALSQHGVDLELIVVDEGSTDDTSAVLAAVGDPRLRVIRHDAPVGLSAARNHGADHANGEWLAFLDDDDLWSPDKLARQLAAAREAGSEWVYTGGVNILAGRIVHGHPPLPPEQVMAALPRYNPIPGGGSNVAIRRSLWLRSGHFQTRFPAGGEDWEMSIRLAKVSRPAWVCSPLVAKRLHPTNMTLDVAQTLRAAKLIEEIHQTNVDWGRMHRWVAHSCLRDSRRGEAFGHFARAAVRGQALGVAADLRAILNRKIQHVWTFERPGRRHRGMWVETAAAWLQEFDGAIQ